MGRPPGRPRIDQTKCPKCQERVSGPYPDGLCRHCYDLKRRTVPKDLGERVKIAQETGDWKTLAEGLKDTIQGIADGTVEATATQGRMVQHIMDRAYGRVNKSQEDKAGPLGIVVLPMIGSGAESRICHKCQEIHKMHVD